MTDPYRARPRRTALTAPAPLDGRPLRALAAVHMYPPTHNAGAEVMLHTMLRDLQRRGWDVQVMAMNYRGMPYEYDGVPVVACPVDREQGAHFSWSDVVVTHLDATRRAIAWARHGRPLVHLVHNHRQLTHHRVRVAEAQLVVWNSEWIRDQHKEWGGESIVVRPPVNSADYRVERDRKGAVTLINLFRPKGSSTFWHLAGQFPRRRFLAVRGAYGLQDIPALTPPNVRTVDNHPDVRAIYSQTRVLLVPSHYESWGRVAVEAMASGIPVIANPTPGLLEALTSPTEGACALFADVANPSAWRSALQSLDSALTYRKWSNRALLRSAELDAQSAGDLDAFAEAMTRLATSGAPTLAAHG